MYIRPGGQVRLECSEDQQQKAAGNPAEAECCVSGNEEHDAASGCSLPDAADN